MLIRACFAPGRSAHPLIPKEASRGAAAGLALGPLAITGTVLVPPTFRCGNLARLDTAVEAPRRCRLRRRATRLQGAGRC